MGNRTLPVVQQVHVARFRRPIKVGVGDIGRLECTSDNPTDEDVSEAMTPQTRCARASRCER
jgi:hypothetical protein